MIVTLTGPTCGGKSTLEAALQKQGFGRAISHTTRAPRAGEVDGEHYHFVTDTTFDAMQMAGEFIEVVDLGTRRYAMSAQSLQLAAQRGHVVIVVEPHGAGQIADYCRVNRLDHLGFWVDCEDHARARRWLERTVSDLARPPAFNQAVFDAAGERLGLMLSEEQVWMRDTAMRGGPEDHPHLYRHYIDTTEASADQLAAQVRNLVVMQESVASWDFLARENQVFLDLARAQVQASAFR